MQKLRLANENSGLFFQLTIDLLIYLCYIIIYCYFLRSNYAKKSFTGSRYFFNFYVVPCGVYGGIVAKAYGRSQDLREIHKYRRVDYTVVCLRRLIQRIRLAT